MKITLSQAAAILNRSEDEVLFIANSEGRLPITLVSDQELTYNKDGTISFNDDVEHTTPEWIFELEDVLAFKKDMDEGLVGTVEKLLES